MAKESSDQIQRIHSDVRSVTVYQNQARVSRTVTTDIAVGKQQLLLIGLPNTIDTSTIQVKGKGDFTILGIRFETITPERENFPEELNALALSIEKTDEELSAIGDKLYLIKQEEDFLLANQQIGGKRESLTVEQIKDLSVFMSQGFGKVISNRQKALKKKKELEKHQVTQKEKFNKLIDYQRANSLQVILDIESNSRSGAQFTIDYLSGNCGWYPEYDVRADSENGTVVVNYKANVYQRSGEKWDGISLVLSSGNPSKSNSKPSLRPWYLTTELPASVAPSNIARSASPLMKKSALQMKATANIADEELAISVEDLVETSETAINISYAIDAHYQIPSDGKPIAISLKEFTPAVELSYAAVPKLDNCGFLTATISEWDVSNLLPGTVQIYLDGTYVGKSFLDTKTTEEEIRLPLGRDERIIITREQQKHKKSSASFIGNKKKEVFVYQIPLKNGTGREVKLLVEDMVPISKDSEIQVKIVDSEGAKHDEIKGLMTWKLILSQNETTILEYSYEITYPKDKPPIGL
ncbi:MAG: DUF4139 domain-containing protein [Cyclobacteriaceae bacterium]